MTRSPSRLSVVVVTAAERRQRYRFVTEPLTALGHAVEVVTLGSVPGLLARARALLQRRERPDVVILIGLGPKMLPIAWAARRAGVPLIARLGGDPVRDQLSEIATARAHRHWLAWARGRVNLLARRRLLRIVDGLIVVNPGLVAPLRAQTGGRTGGRDVPIAVVPQFCPGPAEPRGYGLGGRVELVTVTNLAFTAKAGGVLWLADRLIGMANEGAPPMRLRIAGGGAHLDEVVQGLTARTLPPGLEIEALGFVRDIEALYRQADVFVYRSDHDGTPNVFLEAKRFALPLIANACEEFETLVEDGATGLLYHDAAGFRAGLNRLMADQALRARLGEAALQDHLTRFTVDAAGRELEAALAGARPTPARG